MTGDSRVLYKFRIHNLELPVRINPSEIDGLNALLQGFAEHLTAFNNGTPPKLLADNNTRLILYAILSYLSRIASAQSQSAAQAGEAKPQSTPQEDSQPSEAEKPSEPDESKGFSSAEVERSLEVMINLCDLILHRR